MQVKKSKSELDSTFKHVGYSSQAPGYPIVDDVIDLPRYKPTNSSPTSIGNRVRAA